MRPPRRLRNGARAAPGRWPGRHRAPRHGRTPLRLAAASVVAGAAVGVALVGHAASAQPGWSVEFVGSCGLAGLGLLGAEAYASPERLSVPPGSEVAFTSRFGRPAILRVDGGAAVLVAPGEAFEIAFERGPVTITMQIGCLVGERVASVTVEVSPTPPAVVPSSPAGSATPTGTAADPPRQREPEHEDGSEPSGPEPSGPEPSGPEPEPPRSGPDDPGGWQAVAPPAPADRGQPTGGNPEPPGQDSPAADAGSGTQRREQPGAGALLAPSTVDHSADGGIDDTDDVVTDRVAGADSPPRGDEPVELLALVATACVVGTSAGVVRAMIAQRAGGGGPAT
jgi:hypothetical protein